MNKRKAKKRVKKELGLQRWPFGRLPPRLAKAMYLDLYEAIAERMDYAILYGKDIGPTEHINRHLEAVLYGTKLKEKYTVNLFGSPQNELHFRAEAIINAVRRCVHAE